MLDFSPSVSVAAFTTLKAGGKAENFACARSHAELSELVAEVQVRGMAPMIMGWGSNVLISDRGIPGYVILNRSADIDFLGDGELIVGSGCGFQELFLKCAQRGLGGLQFAVGIPGSVGGALVSNAGAYRNNLSAFVTEIELGIEASQRWTDPSWMEFSYRDSILRREDRPNAVLLRLHMKLPKQDPKVIYDEGREYQRQRISKQPPSASAGSFFKNVNDEKLANSLETLPEKLRASGVVPAGYLIEGAGLKGFRYGGAEIGRRHANFIVNTRGATATEIRQLADFAREVVFDRFGVKLEEEALYVGDWSGWPWS